MSVKKIKIGIIGVGMVGSQLARWFLKKRWKRGKNLFCYDADMSKGFSDDASKGDIIFICVPTPPNADGSCNISIVEKTVEQFRDLYKIIVVKSTVEPGTAAKLAKKYNCKIFFNPEFLTEKNAWEDFIKPDRQIVACANGRMSDDKACWHREYVNLGGIILKLLPLACFSSPQESDEEDLFFANSTEAEIGKYGANVFGAMKVTFANIIFDLCRASELDLRREKIYIDVNPDNVLRIIARDKRIGPAWMNPNHGKYRGFGGFCFPKDLAAFIAFAERLLKYLKNFLLRCEDLSCTSSPSYGKALKCEKLVSSGLNVLKAIQDYNITLLDFQELTLNDVCRHDSEVEKIMEEKRRAK